MMTNVVRLKRKRKETIRGVARAIVTDATRSLKHPCAVVIVVLSSDGCYALRTASDGTIKDFDKYSRAIALMQREQQSLITDQ